MRSRNKFINIISHALARYKQNIQMQSTNDAERRATVLANNIWSTERGNGHDCVGAEQDLLCSLMIFGASSDGKRNLAPKRRSWAETRFATRFLYLDNNYSKLIIIDNNR